MANLLCSVALLVPWPNCVLKGTAADASVVLVCVCSRLLGALNQAFCGVVHADSAKLVNPADGHSYQRFDTALYWNSAKAACAGLGGHLATVTSQAEN
jgi:hypothetical protein